MIVVACSCGVPNCPELGWPHEWDPIAAGDACVIVPPPTTYIGTLEENGSIETHFIGSMLGIDQPHRVQAPYVRWGSGYACAGCVEHYTLAAAA